MACSGLSCQTLGPKRMSMTALADALRLILDGGIFVPPMSLPDAMHAHPHGVSAHAAATRQGETAPYQTLPSFETLGLTPRQIGYALKKHDIELKHF